MGEPHHKQFKQLDGQIWSFKARSERAAGKTLVQH